MRELLHDGVNVVFHLRPAPVVARVATLTPLLRPAVGRHFGREVALAGALADVHPGWEGQPLDTPLEDLAVFLDRGAELGADPALVARLGELTGRLRPLLTGRTGFLHGDAHPGNLLATTGGWRWTDLEDTSRGPRGWDLACLRATSRLDGRAAVDALPDPMTDAELAPFRWLRLLHGAAWWFVHAAPDARTPRGGPGTAGRLGRGGQRRPGGTASGSRVTRNRARGSCREAGGRAADRGTTRSKRALRRCGSSSRPAKA